LVLVTTKASLKLKVMPDFQKKLPNNQRNIIKTQSNARFSKKKLPNNQRKMIKTQSNARLKRKNYQITKKTSLKPTIFHDFKTFWSK
jgi:hypothetical protein